jgi:hypothetical protein
LVSPPDAVWQVVELPSALVEVLVVVPSSLSVVTVVSLPTLLLHEVTLSEAFGLVVLLHTLPFASFSAQVVVSVDATWLQVDCSPLVFFVVVVMSPVDASVDVTVVVPSGVLWV